MCSVYVPDAKNFPLHLGAGRGTSLDEIHDTSIKRSRINIPFNNKQCVFLQGGVYRNAHPPHVHVEAQPGVVAQHRAVHYRINAVGSRSSHGGFVSHIQLEILSRQRMGPGAPHPVRIKSTC
jgi:hypothetical protein